MTWKEEIQIDDSWHRKRTFERNDKGTEAIRWPISISKEQRSRTRIGAIRTYYLNKQTAILYSRIAVFDYRDSKGLLWQDRKFYI